jgi:DNA-binding MarR family transcriptional regulator
MASPARPEPAQAAYPRLPYVIARLDRAIRRELEARLRASDLTPPQYTALSVLSARSGLSNAQLARRCYVTPQSMSEVILLLERRGLIRRAPDAANKRILRTVLTPAGRDVLSACDAAVEDVEEKMLATLDSDAACRLRTDLIECVHNLGAGL